MTIPYPWVPGEAHLVKVLTSTGTTFEHEIAVAVSAPKAEAANLGLFTLIGLYVGVIPVALGLLWFPLVSRLGRTGLDALLALTVGLLAFLFVDARQGRARSCRRRCPARIRAWRCSLRPARARISCWRRSAHGSERGGSGQRRRGDSGAVLALLVAVGIGLHNFGEGLAIGAAFALGRSGAGHVADSRLHAAQHHRGTRDRRAHRQGESVVAHAGVSGLIGGVPTIAGAWCGGLVYSPVLAVACLGLGAGAIAQVIGQIGGQIGNQIADRTSRGNSALSRMASAPVALGLVAGFGVMYVTGMLVG